MEATTDSTEDGTDDDGTTDGDEGETSSGTEGGLEWEPVVIEDEIAVEVMPAYRPTQGRLPVAAFDGDQYLAVWEDQRRHRSVLYGARVEADGTSTDPWGFPILDVDPPSLHDRYVASVASDGVDFLVVTWTGAQILGARVSAAGEVLDPDGILIAEPSSAMPSVAFDGEQYMVVWADEGQIHRARVQANGVVLDPDGVPVYSTSAEWTRVGLSFDGAQHLLIWDDYDLQLQSNVINAGRMTPDGTAIDQVPIFIHSAAPHGYEYTRSAAGFDGTNHVIAWVDLGDTQYEILVSRVTPDGTVLDPEGIPIFSESIEADVVHRVEIAAGSGRSQVVWSMDYQGEGGPDALWVRGARVATDGTVSLYPEDTFAHGLDGTVAVHPNGALLLWREGDDWSDDYPAITGTLLDDAGVPVPDSVVVPAATASRQEVKGVASDGHNYFVIWTDTRDPEAEGKALYGGRVGAFGAPLDPEPILLTTWRTDRADVVFDGANYVVTWVHNSGGEGAGAPYRVVRVTPAGERLDMDSLEPPLRSNGYDILDGASDGSNTLMIGVDKQSAESEFAAVLLGQDGSAGDVIHIVDEGEGYALDAAVSFDGVGYLTVWTDQDGVFGHRITQAGELAGMRFNVLDKQVWALAMARGPDLHLLAWRDEDGIWAMRVSQAGQVLDPGGFFVAEAWFGAKPSVVFDGENFVVAWGTPSMGVENSYDLLAARVTPHGDVSPPFEIAPAPESDGFVFLAAGESVLAGYSRFVSGPPYDTRRAMARMIVP